MSELKIHHLIKSTIYYIIYNIKLNIINYAYKLCIFFHIFRYIIHITTSTKI